MTCTSRFCPWLTFSTEWPRRCLCLLAGQSAFGKGYESETFIDFFLVCNACAGHCSGQVK